MKMLCFTRIDATPGDHPQGTYPTRPSLFANWCQCHVDDRRTTRDANSNATTPEVPRRRNHTLHWKHKTNHQSVRLHTRDTTTSVTASCQASKSRRPRRLLAARRRRKAARKRSTTTARPSLPRSMWEEVTAAEERERYATSKDVSRTVCLWVHHTYPVLRFENSHYRSNQTPTANRNLMSITNTDVPSCRNFSRMNPKPNPKASTTCWVR